MQEQLQRRLEELRREYETGQGRLRELEAEASYVREALLRIGGAIQVLQELLGAEGRTGDAAEPPQAEQART